MSGEARPAGTAAPVGEVVGPPPQPTFSVLDAGHREHAASPTMVFRVGVEDPGGREVYTIALSAQVHLDPAKRTYDADTRAALYDMFGAPERWAATTRSLLWRRVDVLVPSFTAATVFELPVPCDYDLEVAATKYLYALPDGEAPLTMHFSGTVLYRGEQGRMQVVPIAWEQSASYRLPVATWRAMIAHHYPHAGWIRLHDDTLALLRARAAAAGHPTMDAAVLALLGGPG